jgi:hypothetical protein
MKVYVVQIRPDEIDIIDKIFFKKEDAEQYILDKNNIEKNRLTECFNNGNFAKDEYYYEALNSVNEGWITEHEVENL